ncbi:MAG: type II secretion system F family protein [Pseudomonadales bacterium]
MELIVNLLGNWFTDDTSLRIAVIALAALVFAVFGLGIAYLFVGATDPVQRRLKSTTAGGHVDIDPDDDPSEQSGLSVTLDTLIGPVSRYILPASDLERGHMKQKLSYAGFKKPNALQTFYAIKTGLAIGLPMLVYMVCSLFPQISTKALLYYTLAASGVGLLVPNIVLERIKEKHMRVLRNGFPDALDLLVVCVEAGLGISQSIQRVGNELEVSHPELAEELLTVNAEVRAGVDRITALKNLSTRTGLEDIRGLVSLLVQTLRFGTSIAESLRIYAEEFRDKRMQAAEEMAAKLGTKLIFPLILFLFPAFFVVAVGPAVIRLVAAFANT